VTESTAARRTAFAASALAIVRALALVVLALSSAAAVDQFGQDAAFCGEGSGCAAVRESDVGRVLSDALPVLGLVGYALVIAASLGRRRAWQRLALVGAATGGVGGAALVALQLWVIGRVCGLCLAADLAGIGAGAVAIVALRRSATAPPPSTRAIQLSLAGLVLALLGPPAWAFGQPPELPPYVRAAAAQNVVTVVELSDFECPYCRAMHPVLAEALRPYGARVRLVRKSIPLPGHRHAFGAAAAHHCARAQGRAEAMADVLFSTDRLALRDCIEHARALGLDVARFEQCLAAKETRDAIEREVGEVRRFGLDGLPTVYVGAERIVGFHADAGATPYVEALDRALRGESPSTRRWALPAVIGLAVLVLLAPVRRTQAATGDVQ
jgi:protein-disulfide isomerase